MVHPMVQSGSVTITGVSTAEKTVAVAFPQAYDAPPTVVASFSVASYNRRLHITNVTATGFSVVVALLSGTSASAWVNWVAVP